MADKKRVESWSTWLARGGHEGSDDSGAIRVPADNTTFDTLEIQPAVMPGSVEVKFIPSIRDLLYPLKKEGVIPLECYMVE